MNNKIAISKRVNSLDGFRWIAIGIIFFAHFVNYFVANKIIRCLFLNATLGVDYFFVLSGFGIYLSESSQKTDNNPPKKILFGLKFAIKKIKDIYIIYIVALLLTVPYSIIMDLKDSSLTTSIFMAIIKFIGCATLLQSVFGSSYTSHALVATTWFLSTLFICYIFCPFLYKKISIIPQKYNRLALSIIILSTFLVGQLMITIEKEFSSNGIIYINDLYYGSPYARIWFVIIGMMIAKIYIDHPTKKYNPTLNLIAWIMIVIWYFIRNTVSSNEGFLRLIDVIVVIILFSMLLQNQDSVSAFCSSKLASTSKHIMLVYIYHLPIIWYINMFWDNLNLSSIFKGSSNLLQFSIVVILQYLVIIMWKDIKTKHHQ